MIDFFRYPFDAHRETNKFGRFLNFLFKEYPAFLWVKPSLLRIALFPVILLYQLFKK
ncbi:MAG: hypothetical protein H6765_09580 [Candidatus Peribacteria bacterium]|nr:MAG: hypothetical protein H6765_09580 [Candidatus Peribacteria bacterium]